MIEYGKEYRKKKKSKKPARVIIYHCSGIYCERKDRYGKQACINCKGRWGKIQLQYLQAFKPQTYHFRWNQI
jgi:hypothetical protein